MTAVYEPLVESSSEALPAARKSVFFDEEADELEPRLVSGWKRILLRGLPTNGPGWPPLVLREILRENGSLGSELEATMLAGLQETLHSAVTKLRTECDSIEVVRKERVFEDEVTEEEEQIIKKRVELQQLQYKLYEQREFSRKISRIKSMFEYLRHEEIITALERTGGDEEAVCINFTDHDFVLRIRKEIANKYESESKKITRTEEQQLAYDRLLQRRKRIVNKTTTSDAKKRLIRYSRLRLDDALLQLEKSDDPEKVFEGWSEARIRAYKQIKTKPNSYYYRFNAPGERQRNGYWTQDERKLFFNRLNEVGANGQWGLFSMTIPGRVGYQCSNFYRSMLKSGEIKDENYTIDEKGELRYLFGKKDGNMGYVRVHSKNGNKLSPSENCTRNAFSSGVKRKRHGKSKRRGYYSDTDEESNEESRSGSDDMDNIEEIQTSKVSWNTTKRTKDKLTKSGSSEENNVDTDRFKYENPLPGFIDPITLEEVIRPTISPHGHVMSYSSWVRCLSAEECKNICPLTKRKLKKRELTVLTFDNIDQYRDRIANI